ncbi:hypothetical protein SERLADRAFT_467625 [Serpula lacrymans var. lacrymans S7.9]|uniref:Uncharacterized protein n=1 Tax=Serpula lacrymans var. lacrymans (strain S7.9) TaxID=578457 RepID=F8NWQ2_SERL9|nr:uncharacterized protein SERLADRAFT_467625 [Serpula lacrymans var. lacrymans S7.9]EGO24404.1 hypothetical protein SERLADRAFT_467625 [Serpula lacrymans var. lacrymans S7.9]
MAFYPEHQLQVDAVSGEQYRYALTNFRIAHEKVEQQRHQLEEQEKQVALLRERIALLEGSGIDDNKYTKQGGNSVDDFSIKNAASQLERLINRWAADIVRSPPAHLNEIYQAIFADLTGTYDQVPPGGSAMQVQNLLRHAMSETIHDAVINCFVVTNSTETNDQLTRIHEHLFSRDPIVACVWRRQTFSAAVESCSPQMTKRLLLEQLPATMKLLSQSGAVTPFPGLNVMESAYEFSRMLHGASSSSGGSVDAFYRSFVPEIGSTLYARQIELVKRCLRSERNETDRVGATIFPGLVKVTKAPAGAASADHIHTVVRRAQVICECALASAG